MTVFRVIFVLAIALLAALLGTLIASDAGYVVVRFRGWEISTSVWAAISALLGLAVLVYCTLKLLSLALPKNSKIADWFLAKRSLSSQRQTLQAIEEETNGNTVEAIRLLVAAGQQSPNPILHFLRASELADRIGAKDKAAELREDAAKLGEDELQVFRQLNDALALVDRSDKRQGLRALRRLLEHHPRCAPALLALVQHCVDVEDWVGALAYLDVLSRLSFAADEEIYHLLVTSWIGRLRQSDPISLSKVWHSVPRKLKLEPSVLLVYVVALREKGDSEKAIHELEKSLSRSWDGPAVLVYGSIEGDTTKQLKTVEGWVKDHADEPVLHLTAGRLHKRLGQLENARAHIERSVSLGGLIDAKLELAEIYFESGETQLANEVMARIKQELTST